MQYDPFFYKGSALYYTRGRPPYSRELVPTLKKLVPLDSQSKVLDVGTGTGTLAVALAPSVQSVVAADPDTEMLSEGRRAASAANIPNIQWLCTRAEELDEIQPENFRAATFGQSFQWTERELTAEIIYDLLEPQGVIILLSHAFEGRPVPAGPGHPPIPHDAIREIIESFLGAKKRAGQGFAIPSVDRNEDALSRTRFGVPQCIFAAGRPDIVQDIDGVIANYLSMSFCAPHLFSDRLAEFQAALHRELESQTTTGLFWDWPGDTEILFARRDG